MMQACISPARIESILTSVKRVRKSRSLTVKEFQKLLCLMSAASNVMHFGLLYMRPLQWWLKTTGLFPRGNPLRMIKVTRRCLRALDMWRKPCFLSQGPVLGAPCRRITLATDASLSVWGAVMSGQPPCPRSVEWSPSQVAHQLPGDAGSVSSTQTLSNRSERSPCVGAHWQHSDGLLYQPPGGLRSRPLYKLAHQILVCSQGKLLSLKAVHIPGHLNIAVDILSRQGLRPRGMDASTRGG